MTKKTIRQLTGKALLQKVQSLSELPRRERAKATGYYTVTTNKRIHVNLTDFYDALLAAKGVSLNPKSSKYSGRSNELTNRVRVNDNGQIVINKTYIQAMGLNPSDQFEIKLDYKSIHLIQIEPDKSELEFVHPPKVKPIENTKSKAVQAFLASLEERKQVYQRLADS